MQTVTAKAPIFVLFLKIERGPEYLMGLGRPAATVRVPPEFSTINAGLNASASGDTVLVAPGTYTDYEGRF